jgi:hypothetical protein
MDDLQGIQLAVAEAMKGMMTESQLAIAPLNTGTGRLKQVDTFPGHFFQQLNLLDRQLLHGAIFIQQGRQ